MKIYSKIVTKIRNNKTRIKKAGGIGIMALGFRYGSINPIPTNLSSNSTQQIEKVHNFEDMQVVDTSGKRNLNNKSSSNLIETGSGAVIEVKTSVPPSKALESTLRIRSGNIEGVDGFGVNPPISQPSSSKYLNSQTFGAKTSLDNDSPDSSDSEDDTCSYPDSSSEYLDQLLSETFDDVGSSSVSSSNNHPISEVPEVSLDYEISDSEEIYDEESNNSDDKQTYSNSMSPGYKSAIDDSYTDSVYQYKYSTSPSRFDRFLRREVYANKKEHELFNKDRTQDDLTSTSKTNIPDKRLKDKLWRHPDFFGLTKPNSSSKTPKEDFFKQHGEDAKRQLTEHLLSPHTRCFKNGFYREHKQSYDYYYNNQTGKLLLVTTNGETGEQEIFSFWTISKMQRLELLNHNHVHKHWKLVEALRKKNVEEKALVEAQNAQKREENRLNEVVSRVEAARRAGEYIKKKTVKQVMTLNKKKCLELLKYEKLVTEKFQQTLGEYDSEKYFELQNQLSYVKDFIIWKKSFSQYFKLFTNFKNGLIDGEWFVDEFFDIFNEDKELLKNFVFNSESFKKLNINPKSSGLVIFLEEISMKCDLFQDDSDIRLTGEIDEDQLRSYIKQIYTDLESFI